MLLGRVFLLAGFLFLLYVYENWIYVMKESLSKGTFHNPNEEPVVVSKRTFDLLLKEERPFDLISLYCFYYYTSKWQNTVHARATNSYVMGACGWAEDRLVRAKKTLIRLGLISVVKERDAGNRVLGHYIHVNFLWSKNHRQENPGYGNSKSASTVAIDRKIPAMEKPVLNAKRDNNKKEKINKKEKPSSANEPRYLHYFFQEYQNDPEFCGVWSDFEMHRKEIKKPLTPLAAKRLISKLTSYGLSKAKKELNRSIEHGWQSVYGEDDSKKTSNDVSPCTSDQSIDKLSPSVLFAFEELKKVYCKLNRNLEFHEKLNPILIGIVKGVRVFWKELPDVEEPDSKYDTMKEAFVHIPNARHDVKGEYGNFRSFVKQYCEFVLEKLGGMSSMHINALAVESQVWSQFVHKEQQRVGLNFKTGRKLV